MVLYKAHKLEKETLLRCNRQFYSPAYIFFVHLQYQTTNKNDLRL